MKDPIVHLARRLARGSERERLALFVVLASIDRQLDQPIGYHDAIAALRGTTPSTTARLRAHDVDVALAFLVQERFLQMQVMTMTLDRGRGPVAPSGYGKLVEHLLTKHGRRCTSDRLILGARVLSAVNGTRRAGIRAVAIRIRARREALTEMCDDLAAAGAIRSFTAGRAVPWT